MTSVRHLEDQKRGYPTTVGALAVLVVRHGIGAGKVLGVPVLGGCVFEKAFKRPRD